MYGQTMVDEDLIRGWEKEWPHLKLCDKTAIHIITLVPIVNLLWVVGIDILSGVALNSQQKVGHKMSCAHTHTHTWI